MANILEAAEAILKSWDAGQTVDAALIETLRKARADEIHANEPPAASGYQRDRQHDSRERVARWGRMSLDGKFRFVRGCDNDLAFYSFYGTKYVSFTISEDGEAVVMFSDRNTKETDVHYADITSFMRMLGRLVP